MKTDLSSKIRLDQVSKRYYQPESELELASLTRFEKVTTQVAASSSEGARAVALEIAQTIEACVKEKGRCVMGLGAGRCAIDVYDQLVKLYFADKISFANVIVFNLSELGLGVISGDEQRSMYARLHHNLFSKVDIDPNNIHTFSNEATHENVHQLCRAYEAEIAQFGGLDVVVCELTKSGSLALNEPGSALNSSCRLMLLGNKSRAHLAEVFQSDTAPQTAVTLGISNLMSARSVIAVAWGEVSAAPVLNTVEGRMNEQTPASFLQMHTNAKVVVDLEAASQLTRISFPWKVTSCEWTPYLIRRAIVWLCGKTGKPILKLTNKDYNDNGLSELVALYGSAYTVNIKIFNDVQHTITGWPGGKPNADDSSRPERATPYPKRVLVFSPHPDDAVVSMGGTLRRLVEQNHDVHVVFQTNGDISVDDEDVLRALMVNEKIARHYGYAQDDIRDRMSGIMDSIKNKKPGEPDIDSVRYIKGEIFSAEGIMACRYMGVADDHVHEASMPFYTSEPFGHGKISAADVAMMRSLIENVRPHQIFVDDDMGDPQGIHSPATNAVLMAIEELKNEDFMQQCRIWLYRGQWGQWDIDRVEMAVPVSPEEFQYKTEGILKFQSQLHAAQFQDNNDGRLSWQVALDRNRTLAEHYQKLGLASYEAIEAFVQYKPRD
ncbi:MAG: 6-phosphogluconolactonase [Muribaculaceae bacterium]|nr:6-phosphogluconolactonase [Muribaculaceae bacterium]